MRCSVLVFSLWLLVGTVAMANDPSLMLHYEFEDSLTTDSTGNYPGGFAGGAAEWSNDAPAQLALNGLGSRSLDLSGPDSYIAIQNTEEDFNLQSMTVALWMKGSPPDVWRAIVSKFGENGLGWQFRRGGGSAPNLALTLRGVSNEDGQTKAVPELLLEGDWRHYAATHDATTGTTKFYIQGDLFQTLTGRTGTVKATTAPLAIGTRVREDLSLDWPGGIPGLDDVRVYSRVLSDEEIAALCPSSDMRAFVTFPADGYVGPIDYATELITWSTPTKGVVGGYDVWLKQDGQDWEQIAEKLAADVNSMAFPAGMVQDVGYQIAVDVIGPDDFLITGDVATFSTNENVPTLYNFDDGLQGWYNVGPGPDQWTPEDRKIGFTVRHGNDGYHSLMVLRSPRFKLNGSSDLTVRLDGGGSSSKSIVGVKSADLPVDTDGSPNFQGVALRNVATDTYVIFAKKANNGGWQKVTIDAMDLLALDQDAVYTLDLIDSRAGGWGWIKMDDAKIPGAELPVAKSPNPANAASRAGTPLGDGTTDVELSWKAALDPNGSGQVHPLITEYYVFMSNGTVDSDLYYLGTVAQVQPDADPNTSFGTVNLPQGTAYSWVVVEAFSGSEQTFTDTSKLADVNTDNLISDPWTFKTSAPALIYDFDDGTLQGWMNVGPGPDEWVNRGSDIDSRKGDSPHSALILRSPEFKLSGSGDLSVRLDSGRAGNDNESVVGYSPAALAAHTSDASGLKTQGVAIRDVATGLYVAFAKVSSDGGWETVMISAAELAALDQDAVYTLDLIDSREGSWAHTQMDDVVIPGMAVNP